MYQVTYINEITGETCYKIITGAESEQQAKHMFWTQMRAEHMSFTIKRIMYI